MRNLQRNAWIAATLSLLLPAIAAADNGAGVIRWRGRVDGETVIEVRGEEVRRAGSREPAERVSASRPLPDRDCTVFVRPLGGRALVSVEEQPDRYNDWTATVVVVSSRHSAEDVEIELLWLSELPRAGSGWGQGRGADEDETDDVFARPPLRGRDGLRWKGIVDGADEVQLRGDQVSVSHLRYLPVQAMDYRVSAPLPARPVDLELVRVQGRGQIRLTELPSAANGWRATVRVDDGEDRGASLYQFELSWERPPDVPRGGSGRPLQALTWSGVVDGATVLVARGDQLTLEHVSGRPAEQARHSFTAALPKRGVVVNLRRIEGRGSVRIESQPAAENGFTLRVRIEDDKRGADSYRLELTWESPAD